MTEISITTNKMNHLIDPVLKIWGWEVAAYLFLGGLTAGILIISSVVLLFGRQKQLRWAGGPLLFLSPVFLSIGMFTLLLDLENKLNAWRFYMTFQIKAPMSWGAWILIIVYPLNILLMLSVMKETFPQVDLWLDKMLKSKGIKFYRDLVNWSESHLKELAAVTLPVGIGLGIYTGILLSAYVARPLWDSAILGPLFLISGLSTSLALVLLFTKDSKEYEIFSRIDAIIILFEIAFLILWGFNMFTSNEVKRQAVQLITGGEYTTAFWIFFVSFGIFFPLALEVFEMKGIHVNKKFAPILILIGGFMFRYVLVYAGQVSNWVHY